MSGGVNVALLLKVDIRLRRDNGRDGLLGDIPRRRSGQSASHA